MAVRFNSTSYYIRTTPLPPSNGWSCCFWAVGREHGGTEGTYIVAMTAAVTSANLASITMTRPSVAAAPVEAFTISNTVFFPAALASDAAQDQWFFCGLSQSGTGTNACRAMYIRHDEGPGWTMQKQIEGPTYTSTYLVVAGIDTNIWFGGSVARLKVWNTALSDAELLAEKDSYPVVHTANLFGFYPFTSVDGADQSGGGHDLTVIGRPTLDSNEANGPPTAPAPSPSGGGLRFRVRTGDALGMGVAAFLARRDRIMRTGR